MKITHIEQTPVINYTRKEALALARQLLQQVETHVRLNDEIDTGGVPMSPPPIIMMIEPGKSILFNLLP